MFTDGALRMPDGETVNYWGFEDPSTPLRQRALPSPTIRVREGECVHIKLETQCAAPAQTVGARSSHASARLRSTSNIYQWQPRQAGTWLYQSHDSSLKQFEMGLFGLLIVDPEPSPCGRARAYRDGPAYDVERCWIFDDVDPAWHAGESLAKGGAGVAADSTFNPRYFLVNGVPNVETPEHADVAIEARPGDKILLRLLNASFSLLRTRIQALSGDIISADGKALAGPERPWSTWSRVNPGQPVYMATGARHDLLIDLGDARNPVQPGQEYRVTFEFLDWSKRAVRNAGSASPLHVGRAETVIRVV